MSEIPTGENPQAGRQSAESPYTQRDIAMSWMKVEISRNPERPLTLDYASRWLEDWVEFHGDRQHEDDPAIVAGLGKFNGRTIALIGNQKAHDAHGMARRRMGWASPSGFRKAVRVMKVAERFNFPVVTLVDAEGAYPGERTEKEGQGGTIARTQAAMLNLEVPIVSTIISRGGSGGAIAIAVADRVLMMEKAQYTVISPDGGAAILWKEQGPSRKPRRRGIHKETVAQILMEEHKRDMAVASRGDAASALGLGVIDAIVPEPLDGAHKDYDEAARMLGQAIEWHLRDLEDIPIDTLLEQRRTKFRNMGVFIDKDSED